MAFWRTRYGRVYRPIARRPTQRVNVVSVKQRIYSEKSYLLFVLVLICIGTLLSSSGEISLYYKAFVPSAVQQHPKVLGFA